MYMHVHCIYLHNDDIIITNVFDWLAVAGEHRLKLSIVGFKHTQLENETM